MSKLREEFELEIDPGTAQSACIATAERLRWKVAEVEPRRLLLKVGLGFVTNPAKLEVTVGAGERGTTVRIDGRIAQVGPIGKRKLRGCVDELRESLRLATKPPPAPPAA